MLFDDERILGGKLGYNTSAPSEYTEMVGMGLRLEEGVRERCLSKDGGSSSEVKKHGKYFYKKKEESNSISHERQRRPRGNGNSLYVVDVTLIVNVAPAASAYQQPQRNQQPN